MITHFCEMNRLLPSLENRVNHVIQKMDEKETTKIVFDTIDSFKWYELFFASPYTLIEEIEGYNFRAINSISLSNEKYMFLDLFIRKRKLPI